MATITPELRRTAARRRPARSAPLATLARAPLRAHRPHPARARRPAADAGPVRARHRAGAEGHGGCTRSVDYEAFVAIGTVGLLIPLNTMFAGIGVIVDRESGAQRELLAAPIPRRCSCSATCSSRSRSPALQLAVADRRRARCAASTSTRPRPASLWFARRRGAVRGRHVRRRRDARQPHAAPGGVRRRACRRSRSCRGSSPARCSRSARCRRADLDRAVPAADARPGADALRPARRPRRPARHLGA